MDAKDISLRRQKAQQENGIEKPFKHVRYVLKGFVHMHYRTLTLMRLYFPLSYDTA